MATDSGERWDLVPLGSVANFVNGDRGENYPSQNDYVTSGIPFISATDLVDGSTDSHNATKIEVELWCGGRGALNQHLFKVTSRDFPQWFYYHWTRQYLENFRLIASSKATTMGHIQRKHLTEAKVLVPPPCVIEALTPHIQPLLNQIIANRTQSRTLATLRDTLLPKLLSGELHVTAA